MSQTEQLKAVELLLENGKATKAKEAFFHLVPENTVKYFLVLGKIEQKFQHWGDAINAYNKVLAIDPENKEAENNLHLIQNILNFWNPDMFNP